jgi:hypothetical protein
MSEDFSQGMEPTSDLPAEGQTVDDVANELLGDEETIVDLAEEARDAGAPDDSNDELSAKEEALEEEIKELKKKFKLKIDGKEEEVEIDFNDDDKLTRELQKARAFDKRSQEYSQLRNQVNQVVDRLRQNPMEVLIELGLDPDEISEKHLAAKLEEMKKSPEQLEKERMEKELEDHKRKLEEIEKEKEDVRMEQLRNQHASEIENDINSALESSETMLPKGNALAIKRVAEAMMLAMKKGFNDVKPVDVIPFVEQQFVKDVQNLVNVLPEELLPKLLGEQGINKARKYRLNNSKRKANTRTARQIVKETGEKSIIEKDDKKRTFKDFFGKL